MAGFLAFTYGNEMVFISPRGNNNNVTLTVKYMRYF